METGHSDFDLLDRWGQGERAAAGELFERHFDALFRFFQRRARGSIEDLVQQTLLACMESRTRFRRQASFRTYLFQTARFQLWAQRRGERRMGHHVDAEQEMQLVDLGTSPSGALARKQETSRLVEALQRIPLQYQIVLELSIWESLTSTEIAKILRIPEGTTRSRLRLALHRLRDEMQKQGNTRDDVAPLGHNLHEWARRVRQNAAPLHGR